MALYKVLGTLEGTTPVQLQNPMYQHPSEPLYKIRTPISQKRKKTEEDYITLSKLDFLMSCHWAVDDDDCDCVVDSNGNVSFDGFKNPYMPAEMLRKSIRNSAKALKNQKGAAFDRGVTVTEDMPFDYQGAKDCNGMWEEKSWVRLRGERSGSLIWITRVKIPKDWSVNFSLTCDTSQVELTELETMLKASGKYSGVGSYRPEKGGNAGKFEVTEFEYEEIALL